MKIFLSKKFQLHNLTIWNPSSDTYYKNIAIGYIRFYADKTKDRQKIEERIRIKGEKLRKKYQKEGLI